MPLTAAEARARLAAAKAAGNLHEVIAAGMAVLVAGEVPWPVAKGKITKRRRRRQKGHNNGK